MMENNILYECTYILYCVFNQHNTGKQKINKIRVEINFNMYSKYVFIKISLPSASTRHHEGSWGLLHVYLLYSKF